MSRDFIRLLPTFMVFLPMLGSLLLLVTPKRWRDEVAGLLCALTLGIGFMIWRAGGSDLLSVPWVPALGITYSTELSGVSLALAMVTAFMSFIAP